MPSTLRWLLIHTSTPALISSRAISAWMSEKPIARSGSSLRISPIFALVKAETFGFSLRARGGRTVKPEMPTMRASSPSAYSTSVGSSVRQTMRRGKWSVERGSRAAWSFMRSMTQHGYRDLALMRIQAVLPEINALPGTQQQFAAMHRYGEAHASEDRADVRRHVIGAFRIVFEQRVAIRHHAGEPALQVVAHAGIGIFAKQQRATGMRGENMRQAHLHVAAGRGIGHLRGDIAEAAAARVHDEAALRHMLGGQRTGHGYNIRLVQVWPWRLQRTRSCRRNSAPYQNS